MTQKIGKKISKTKLYDKRFLYLKTLNKVLGILIILSGTYFVISINDLSIKGFVLSDLKQASNQLNKTNEEIELKIMALESYDNILERASSLKMVRVDRIE